MQPEHGGRMILRLESADAEAVAYRVELQSLAGSWLSTARLVLADGGLAFDNWTPPAPPAWLVEATRAQLRALWRSHAVDGRWPRRTTRWRDAPAS